MIKVSDIAQKYFVKLLNYQKKGTQIRIFLKKVDAPYLGCGICYYFPIPNNIDDLIIKFHDFSIYFNKTIAPFIQDTKIDLIKNNTNTSISIASPNLNFLDKKDVKNQIKSSTLEDQIKHILHSQINPTLSMHGGSVDLVQVTEDFLVILKFHGGCNGCSMAYYTIKEGIEKILKKNLPNLKGVIDITQHKHGKHSFF